MKKNYHLYLGKAGHLAVMAEFLTRGWNVAIPEVDIGDDIFVVQDDNGTLRRVQVKTATTTVRQNSFSCQFKVPLNPLKNITNILVHYVFIARHDNQWTKPIIIRQDYLYKHFEIDKMGSESKDNIIFYFSFSNEKIECSGYDLSQYISDYSDFPILM
jgi:hypothetical protein